MDSKSYSQKYFFCKADATKLPFKDNSFDTIFNSEMIEHLYPQDSKKMLDEFFRVLKPGGKLIITTPNRSEYRRLIQESFLSVMLFFMRKKGLMEREKLKSKLFKVGKNVKIKFRKTKKIKMFEFAVVCILLYIANEITKNSKPKF